MEASKHAAPASEGDDRIGLPTARIYRFPRQKCQRARRRERIAEILRVMVAEAEALKAYRSGQGDLSTVIEARRRTEAALPRTQTVRRCVQALAAGAVRSPGE